MHSVYRECRLNALHNDEQLSSLHVVVCRLSFSLEGVKCCDLDGFSSETITISSVIMSQHLLSSNNAVHTNMGKQSDCM